MQRFLTILIMAFILGCVKSFAVPAYPGPIYKVQPNGDTITIRLRGDERIHFTTTIDGYLIGQNDDGYYCYIKIKNNGTKKVTKHIAHNANQRTNREARIIERYKNKNEAYNNKK